MVMPMPGMPPPEMGPPPGEDAPEFPPLQFLPPEMFQQPGAEFFMPSMEPEGPIPPDVQTIEHRAHRIKDFWRERDIRMDEDYELYSMVEARRKRDEEGEKIVRNIINTLVEKSSNMVGAQTPVISVEAARLDQREPAQRVENLLRHAWEQWNYKWMLNLHTPMRRDAAHFLILRGWLAARVAYNPYHEPDEVPVDLTFADPRYVYPCRGGNGKLRYVVHTYPSTIGEVLDEWPESAEFFHSEDDDQECEVTAYYDDWWHSVLVDGFVVKEPTEHGYGFVPWVFGMGNGAPIRSTEGKAPKWTSEAGVSLFHSIKHPYRQQNRVLSQIATEVARASNPPTVYFYNRENDEMAHIDLSPGSTSYLMNDERFQFVETTPNPNNVGPLLSALSEDIEKGGLPEVLWGGDQAGSTSGFAIALLSGAARDSLYGVISALQFSYEMINRYALMLIRDHHPDPVGVIVRDRHGNFRGSETVYPEEIAAIGVNNRVKFRDVAPQDKFQQIQAAIALTDKNLVSMEYARDELIGVDDPEEENQRVLNEMIYRDDEILKDVLNPLSLYRHSPELFDVWMSMQKFKRFEEEKRRWEEQQMMQQGPPGPPPMGPENGGMPPMPGVPPQMAPAPMGPEMFDQMMQSQGSAAGGAGQQRVPMIPGAGGQIPGGGGV